MRQKKTKEKIFKVKKSMSFDRFVCSEYEYFSKLIGAQYIRKNIYWFVTKKTLWDGIRNWVTIERIEK